MAEELHLALLGHLEILRSGLAVTGFTSNKVQALLCYLAVTGRPHLRPALAGLLWGELPEASAHNNLRKALSILHRLVGPYLDIRRDSVAFNRTSAYWLDVEAFEDGVGCSTGKNGVEPLEKAVALYRDDFLAGFYVHNAPAFEEWALAERARLRMLALEALHTLAVHYSRLGDEGRAAAMGYTARLLALEPWREEAHRQLMLLLAAGGQRSAALAQYETCRRMLMEELGVEPDHETTALFESIRDGTFMAPEAVAPPPPFLQVAEAGKEAEAAATARSVFVGRGQELAQLGGFLDQALAGHGRVAFVIGEPGSGKTVLAHEFVRQAMDAHPDLLAVHGRCNAYTGIGDPYLPFLEMLQMLTGDDEAEWAGGAITGDHARRLWALMPDAVQALIDYGPELIDRFVPGAALLARARAGTPRQATALSELLERRAASGPGPAMLQQTDLFEQYTKVLAAVSRQHPLILLVDDLQWADAGSIGLLFHLGRRLAGSRILLLGAYRPGDVAMGRPAAGSASERHPLEPVLLEFQRDLGDIYVDLAQAEGRQFVDALLDTEPNRLDAGFREVLHRTPAGILCLPSSSCAACRSAAV
jgi:DNA-binding SARP family transcriptional activator